MHWSIKKKNHPHLLFFLLLGMIALFSCSAGDSDDEFQVDGDSHEDGDRVEDEIWNPGDSDAEDNCTGSGYGYGDNCRPPAVDCSQDPCIFGQCREIAGAVVCDCWEGYDGKFCDECAEGFVIRGLRCIKLDACADFGCVFGDCIVINATPVCNCLEGYAGTLCDACAEGYKVQDLHCEPE